MNAVQSTIDADDHIPLHVQILCSKLETNDVGLLDRAPSRAGQSYRAVIRSACNGMPAQAFKSSGSRLLLMS